MKPKVKICGITNLIDAKNAFALGADYIGFVNVLGSPRYLTLDQIAEISLELSPEERLNSVILTEESHVDNIVNSLNELGIKTIQPYGDLKLKDLRALRLLEFDVFMPHGIHSEEDLYHLKGIEDFATLIVLDTKLVGSGLLGSEEREKIKGGTGKTFNWELFNKAKEITCLDLALAGGLNPENIREAIKITDPFMIDISSGLESEAGIKSLDKMKALFSALK